MSVAEIDNYKLSSQSYSPISQKPRGTGLKKNVDPKVFGKKL
jgi:hypothetical protein